MDMALFEKIVIDASKYKIETIDLCGFGEPLLDVHLRERLEFCRKAIPKARIFLSTTGYHLTEDKFWWISEYSDTIKFSIYGITKPTYEAVHGGKLVYETSLMNIMRFVIYCLARKRRCHLIGMLLLNDKNEYQKDEWLHIWEPIFHEVMVWKPHNWITGRSYREIDRTNQESCGRPENAAMYIHADGSVSPCCFDPNNTVYLGNMNDQTLEEVYHGTPYNQLREAHKNRQFEGYSCQHCDQTNYNPDVLVYSNNIHRRVGQLVSNEENICLSA